MKSSILIFILVFFQINISNSQTNWFSQTSGTTKKLYSVHFINTLTGFAVGDSETVLKTSNGGNNWISQYLPPFVLTVKLKSIFFLDENIGFIIGGNNSLGNGGVCYKTSNGGTNWNISSSFPLGMNCIFFINAISGYAVGSNDAQNNQLIFKSINGGNHWSQQYNYSNFYFNSVYFTNINTGYVAGYSSEIFKTTNGGINWISNVIGGVGTKFDIQFLNDSIGFISCAGGRVMKTIDRGLNWSIIPVLGITDDFYSLFFTSINTGFAVGIGSTIVKTTDGGNEWEANLSPSNQDLNSIYFGDANTGYAVGNGGTIIKTTNGGGFFSGLELTVKVLIEGMFFPIFNQMTRKDTIKVFLRNSNSPYLKVDSAKSVIDSISFSGLFNFTNAQTGSYYIVVNHFNSLETWSRAGGENLWRGLINNYDFTNLITQAYGSNLKLKGGKYCVISGDVDQDGFIDGSDFLIIDNDASSFRSGRFIPSDLDGNNFVDGLDMLIGDNNRSTFVIIP